MVHSSLFLFLAIFCHAAHLTKRENHPDPPDGVESRHPVLRTKRSGTGAEKRNQIDVVITETSVDDWLVIRVPGDGNCLFYSFLVMLNGHAAVTEANGIWRTMRDEKGAQDLRKYFADHITTGDPLDDQPTVASVNLNLLETSRVGYIPDKYNELRKTLESQWGDENALKLFTYFTGKRLYVLFALTSSPDDLDWKIFRWIGKTSSRNFMDFNSSRHVGPPYALLNEQSTDLRGQHWNVLVYKTVYNKFLKQSMQIHHSKNDIGVPLRQHLATVTRRTGKPIKQGLKAKLKFQTPAQSEQHESGSSIDVSTSSTNDWNVIQFAKGANSMFCALLVVLNGKSEVIKDGSTREAVCNEPAARSLRLYFEQHVTLDPARLGDHSKRLTVSAMKENLFEQSGRGIKQLYGDLRNRLATAPGDEKVLKLFAYFAGQPINVLFAITSTVKDLDWGQVSWEGTVNDGRFSHFNREDHLGPPYALLYEQFEREGSFLGNTWHLLMHKRVYKKFIDQCKGMRDKDEKGNTIDYDIGIELTTYLKEFLKNAKAKRGYVKQGPLLNIGALDL